MIVFPCRCMVNESDTKLGLYKQESSNAYMMLKTSSSDTGCLIDVSSSHDAMILSISMCALPPSFNFSSPNQRCISAPTTIEHCSKRALSIVKYAKALFLLISQMKREVGSIVAIICWTFMSFSIHTARLLVYSATTFTSSRVFAVHPFSCPTAGSMGLGVVPLRC